jgi:hypothetical protein
MVRPSAWIRTWPGRGLLAVIAIVLAGLLIPAIFQWHVHANSFAPLTARWRPRFGPGTIPSVVIAAAAWRWAPTLCRRLRWHTLMLAAFAAAFAWLVALAVVDGRAGLAASIETPGEYLVTARHVQDIGAVLRHFVAHIGENSSNPWPTHVAGHPPGALLFFVLLVRLHLGGALAAALVVTVIAATTPVAVALTLRLLGTERLARRAVPFLVFGPAAVWSAVSGDAVFTAVAAWGLCTLAASASGGRRTGWAVIAGGLLGCCAYLSYGLALVALLAIGVLVAARTWRPLPYALVGVGAVVAAFTASGFAWWQALPVVKARYYSGIASTRPASYWLWGDLAALAISAGLAIGPALGASAARVRGLVRGRLESRPVAVLSIAAVLCIGAADASLLSRAEVERIWLPFVPWLLLGVALLPSRWRQRLLATQLVTALLVQTLLYTRW